MADEQLLPEPSDSRLLTEIELRAALEDAAEYLRLGMTWIVDNDRHDKMKRGLGAGTRSVGL